MTRNAALPPTVLLLALLIGSPPHSHAGEPPSPPETPARPVVDEYHGVKVTDPYRWLEDGRSPEVKAWTAAQNRYARASLDALPALPAIRRRLERLQGAGSPDHFALRRRGGRLFALKSQPPKDQPLLVVMDSADRPETERVLVDPNALNPKGTTAIDFYVPSLDGRLVAVCMSENGTEDGTVRVFDAEGRPLPDVVPRVNGGTAGGSLAWNAEGTGFHYTRYPRAPERPREDLDFYQQVYFHRLGTPTADDRYVLGKDFPRIAEVELHTDAEGRFLLVSVANGDGGEFAHHLLGPSGTWTQISRFADKVVGAGFGGDGALYLLSRADAPMGKILRLPLPAAGSAAAVPPPAEAEVVVPAGDAAIEGFLAAETRLYVVDMVGGPSRVRVFDLGGRERTPVPLPPIASVGQLVRLDGDEILLRVETFLTPPAWHRFDPAAGRAMPTALKRTSPADFGDCEAVRETAVSKDGTRVPMTVLRR
jgi:prolyl oligopeptidase